MGPWSSSVLENAILPQNKFLVLVSEENIRNFLLNQDFQLCLKIQFYLKLNLGCGLMPTGWEIYLGKPWPYFVIFSYSTKQDKQPLSLKPRSNKQTNKQTNKGYFVNLIFFYLVSNFQAQCLAASQRHFIQFRFSDHFQTRKLKGRNLRISNLY